MCAGGSSTYALPPSDQALREMLDEALEIFRATRSERWSLATDPNERYESSFGVRFTQNLLKQSAFSTLFRIADESFEAEINRGGGAGRGQDHPLAPLSPAPVHLGERGGLDGFSCRACHFSGGPDGGGSGSQLTLFRGDGRRLSSATHRDPPHVMGLGYIQLLATQMQEEIDRFKANLIQNAKLMGKPYRRLLRVKGTDYGAVTALPDGHLDLSEVKGISKDLILRPFGWKGRHRDLATLSDEALQVHHGLQSVTRTQAYSTPETRAHYLGPGSTHDPDQDGKAQELGDGQGLTLAIYLSLLGTPQIKPPTSSHLSMAWARGQQRFEEIGCADCHRPMTRVRWAPLTLKAQGSDQTVTFDLKAAGQDPKPRQVDFSPNEDGTVDVGLPLFFFSDLKRHDLGPDLADPVSEALPDLSGEVSGSMWLTRPLWGLADTPPYLHDGRAQTIEEAILWHGGEGRRSQTLYKNLTTLQRGELRLFLMSLSRDGVLLVDLKISLQD